MSSSVVGTQLSVSVCPLRGLQEAAEERLRLQAEEKKQVGCERHELNWTTGDFECLFACQSG
jgi:hypothetical protein